MRVCEQSTNPTPLLVSQRATLKDSKERGEEWKWNVS